MSQGEPVGASRVDDRDVRIGIIGTDNTHAYQFTAFMNGWGEDEPIPVRLPNGVSVPDMYLWATLLRRLENEPSADVPVSGARVTALWSADRSDADRMARACGIETVCATPEEACEDVDAVMVLSERPETHLPYARYALERGLPTYVDKPLAESVEAGREIFAVAERCGARCFTGSAIRWSPQFLAARDHVRSQFGQARALYVPCPLGLKLYGVHAVEMVNLFLGHDVESVQVLGGSDRQVVLLEFRDGASAVFEHLNFLRWPTYSATLYGETWDYRVVLDEPGPTMLAMTRAFVDFARGGPVPVPPSESLRLIEIVAAAEEALRTGRRVQLAAHARP